MGMSVAGGKKKRAVRPHLNVTPLVDVVLVLLIIFMVMTPMLTRQFWVNVPKKAEDAQEPLADQKPPVVLSLRKDGSLRINRDPITRDEIGARLPRILAAQGDATVIFDAEDGANYGEAVRVMDLARAAGAVTIAVAGKELD